MFIQDVKNDDLNNVKGKFSFILFCFLLVFFSHSLTFFLSFSFTYFFLPLFSFCFLLTLNNDNNIRLKLKNVEKKWKCVLYIFKSWYFLQYG
jgi:hypothetical protein